MTDQKPTSPPDDPRARLEALRRATARADSQPSTNPAPAPPSASTSTASVPPDSSASASSTTSTSTSAPPNGETANTTQAGGALAVSPQPPSTGHRVWMALGLVWMTVTAIPFLFALWFFGMLLGIIFIAEALERTRGLVPTTYGGAFWLAIVFIVVLVLLEIRTWIPSDDGKQARTGILTALMTRPAFAAVLLLLPTVFLVRWDLRGTDIPDVLTTTALLCVLGYGLFVLPIAFVAASIRLARWLWRLGSRSSFRSGLVSGLSSVFGALATCMLCSPPDPEADAKFDRIGERVTQSIEALGDSVERKGLVDGTLGALTQTADVIPGKSGPWEIPSGPLPNLRASIDECVTRLATSSRRRATVDQATSWLMRNKSADRDTANSIAYATIWSVCRVHARENLGDLEGYYWKAVKQNYCKNYQRDPLRECPLYDDGHYQCDAEYPYGGHARLDVVLDLRSKLCGLASKDRDIILRTLDGETSVEIANALGMTDANVRQRLKRALERISDA